MESTNIQKALDKTEMVYKDIVDIANDMIKPYTQEVDDLISSITNNVEKLSNSDLRLMMTKLALKSYSFSEIKEKSNLKAECAKALRKEAYAVSFNNSEGSVASKENLATVKISEEVLAETLYNLISDMLSVKADELHRVVDVLKTVLMSRLSEAKLSKDNFDVIE